MKFRFRLKEKAAKAKHYGYIMLRYTQIHGINKTLSRVMRFVSVRNNNKYGLMITIAWKNAVKITKPNVIRDMIVTQKTWRILFFTHELTLTGAPIVLLGFAQIVRNLGWDVVIVSPIDGPLRKEIEKKGYRLLLLKIYSAERMCWNL